MGKAEQSTTNGGGEGRGWLQSLFGCFPTPAVALAKDQDEGGKGSCPIVHAETAGKKSSDLHNLAYESSELNARAGSPRNCNNCLSSTSGESDVVMQCSTCTAESSGRGKFETSARQGSDNGSTSRTCAGRTEDEDLQWQKRPSLKSIAEVQSMPEALSMSGSGSESSSTSESMLMSRSENSSTEACRMADDQAWSPGPAKPMDAPLATQTTMMWSECADSVFGTECFSPPDSPKPEHQDSSIWGLRCEAEDLLLFKHLQTNSSNQQNQSQLVGAGSSQRWGRLSAGAQHVPNASYTSFHRTMSEVNSMSMLMEVEGKSPSPGRRLRSHVSPNLEMPVEESGPHEKLPTAEVKQEPCIKSKRELSEDGVSGDTSLAISPAGACVTAYIPDQGPRARSATGSQDEGHLGIYAQLLGMPGRRMPSALPPRSTTPKSAPPPAKLPDRSQMRYANDLGELVVEGQFLSDTEPPLACRSPRTVLEPKPLYKSVQAPPRPPATICGVPRPTSPPQLNLGPNTDASVAARERSLQSGAHPICVAHVKDRNPGPSVQRLQRGMGTRPGAPSDALNQHYGIYSSLVRSRTQAGVSSNGVKAPLHGPKMVLEPSGTTPAETHRGLSCTDPLRDTLRSGGTCKDTCRMNMGANASAGLCRTHVQTVAHGVSAPSPGLFGSDTPSDSLPPVEKGMLLHGREGDEGEAARCDSLQEVQESMDDDSSFGSRLTPSPMRSVSGNAGMAWPRVVHQQSAPGLRALPRMEIVIESPCNSPPQSPEVRQVLWQTRARQPRPPHPLSSRAELQNSSQNASIYRTSATGAESKESSSSLASTLPSKQDVRIRRISKLLRAKMQKLGEGIAQHRAHGEATSAPIEGITGEGSPSQQLECLAQPLGALVSARKSADMIMCAESFSRRRKGGTKTCSRLSWVGPNPRKELGTGSSEFQRNWDALQMGLASQLHMSKHSVQWNQQKLESVTMASASHRRLERTFTDTTSQMSATKVEASRQNQMKDNLVVHTWEKLQNNFTPGEYSRGGSSWLHLFEPLNLGLSAREASYGDSSPSSRCS